MTTATSYQQSQRVLAALMVANDLAFQLSEALRLAEEAIITDNEQENSNLTTNLAVISAARNSHWVVERGILADIKTWKESYQLRKEFLV